MFEDVQQDSGYTTKAKEGLGVDFHIPGLSFTSDENAVTVADTLKDSESTEIEKAFPEIHNKNDSLVLVSSQQKRSKSHSCLSVASKTNGSDNCLISRIICLKSFCPISISSEISSSPQCC